MTYERYHAPNYQAVVLNATAVMMIISASTTVMTCILYKLGQYNHTTSILKVGRGRPRCYLQMKLYENCTATSGYC